MTDRHPDQWDRYDWLLVGVEPDPAAASLNEYAPTPGGVNSPCSNTGQNALIPKRKGARTKPRANIKKGPAGAGALVDYLSLTLTDASGLLEQIGEEDFAAKLTDAVFGRESNLLGTDFTGNGFQGYTNSAAIVSEHGEIVGRIGCGGNNDTVHLSISGAGCASVADWNRVARAVLMLGAKITRCDLAWDDYKGDFFDPKHMHRQVEEGLLEIRSVGPGKPPKTRYITDHGHRTGCTLYAGRKGHKELCIYEKGRQLGDPDSDWVRCEVRFWAKRANLPASMLTDPLAYLRGAYNVCESIPADVCTKVKTEVVKAEAHATAWARWLTNQCGKSFHLAKRVMGDQFDSFVSQALARPGRPGRFKGIPDADLIHYLREAFNAGRCNPLGAPA